LRSHESGSEEIRVADSDSAWSKQAVSTALSLTVSLTLSLTMLGCSGFSLLRPQPPPPLELEPMAQGEAARIASLELIQDDEEAELRIASDPGVVFDEIERGEGRLVLEARNVELDPSVGTLEMRDGLVSLVEVESSFRDGLPETRITVVSRVDAAFNLVRGLAGDSGDQGGLRVFLASKVELADSSDEVGNTDGLPRAGSEDEGASGGRVVTAAIPFSTPAAAKTEPEPFRESSPPQASAPPLPEAASSQAKVAELVEELPDEPPTEVDEIRSPRPAESRAARAEDAGFDVVTPSPLTLSQLSPAAAMRAAAAVDPGTPGSPTLSAPLSARPATQIVGLELAPLGADAIYRVQGDGQFSYRTFMLPDPLRFVIDLEGVTNATKDDVLPSSSGAVERVRVGQFRPQPEPVARVVFDMRQPGVPLIERDSTGLSIRFVPQPGEPGTGQTASVVDSGRPVAVSFDSESDRESDSEVTEEQNVESPVSVAEQKVVSPDPVASAQVLSSQTSSAESESAVRLEEPVVVDSPEGFRVIRRHAEALGRRDLTSLLADVAEGVEWFTVVGSETVLVSRGREGFLAAMKDRFAHEDAKIEIGEIIDNGRFVTLREKRVWTNTAGLETVSNTLSVFELDEGKIVRFWSYPGQ
jgi:ketosteroid isomerase-like protein